MGGGHTGLCPQGSKVSSYGVFMASVLRIMVWGIYFIFGYLDPSDMTAWAAVFCLDWRV